MDHQDVKQLTRLSPAEQVHFEKLQNIYSIIKTIEYLEWAYMSGKIEGSKYDAECMQLIHQYNLSAQAIHSYQGLDQFIREYNLIQCQMAAKRLREGRSGWSGEGTDKNLGKRVFDITAKIISAIDIVSLGLSSVDQVAPAIRDIQIALNNYPNLPPGYQGTSIVKKWVDFFEGKAATHELTETESRQLKMDLEHVMNTFNEQVLGAQ